MNKMLREVDVDYTWYYETAKDEAGSISVYQNTYVAHEISTDKIRANTIYTFTDIAIYLLVNEWNRRASLAVSSEGAKNWRFYVTSSKVVE